MIEVRIRGYDETKAAHLCNVPFSEIDSVIPRLSAWGVRVADADPVSGIGANIVGEFIVEEGEAYFIVIVGGDD